MQRTVLIVDDHPSFRATARLLLQADGWTVVGEARDGMSGVSESARLRPDLVLLDVNLPDIDGFEVAARIRDAGDPPVIVLVSSRDERDFGELVERCGAAGFVSKADLSGGALQELVG